MTAALLVSVAGLKLTKREEKLLEKLNPVGVSLFGRNIGNKKQLKELTASIKKILGNDVIIAVDQEGGRVRRLAEPEWRSYASQYVLGQLPIEVSKMHAALIAEDLHEVGINFNYAPVLDKAYDCTHEVLKSRCFSNDVAEHGRAMIETYCRNGICPCMKHMPGHGRVKVDPHLDIPMIKGTISELNEDIAPFAANSYAPAGMTAHIVLPEIDDRPITMSAKGINNIIRGKIGFDGLLISDAIEMKALQGEIVERTERALDAGCDVVCYCGGDSDVLEKLAKLSPQLSREGEKRLQKVREIIKREQTERVDYDEYIKWVGMVSAYDEVYDATEVLNKMKW